MKQEVREERQHKRANPKLKEKQEVGHCLSRRMGDFCDIQQYLGLMMKDEKTERENWRITERKIHMHTWCVQQKVPKLCTHAHTHSRLLT